MPEEIQNFEHHAKFVTGFHRVLLPIFAINLFWSIYQVFHAHSAESVMSLLLAIAFILLAFYARIFALTVQDRVIRLEMNLRLQRILPADLYPWVSELAPGQLVALRFASDEELPGLVKKVVEERLTGRQLRN
jgi:hypothetical protein